MTDSSRSSGSPERSSPASAPSLSGGSTPRSAQSSRSDSSVLSGSSSEKSRARRKDKADDKLVRTFMAQHCPSAMKAYHNARKEAMSKLAFNGPAPANMHFALNEKHDVAAAATSSTEPTMVTWDFNTTLLKSPVNREIAASILQRVLQVGDPERSSEAIKERVRTYFETLKRNFARIVAGAMDTENRIRSRARRIARKLDRRQAAHQWAKKQEEGDYSRFDDLFVAEAMSSDDTDDYEDEDGRKIHGLKRSVADWRTDETTQYLEFLDRAHESLAGKNKHQMSKPMRKGVRASTGNKLIPQLIAKHPGIAQFVTSSAQAPQPDQQAPTKHEPLVLPPMPTAAKTPSPSSSASPLPATSDLPTYSIFQVRRTSKSAVKKTQPPVLTDGERLEQKLTLRGMQRVSNKGAGDCVYLSVGHAIKQFPPLAERYDTVQSLRALFVKEALLNPHVRLLGDADSIRQHLEPGHWDDSVGDAVLEVLLKALHIKATIWTLHEEYELGDSDSPIPSSKIVLLKLWNHWEALEPIGSTSSEPVQPKAQGSIHLLDEDLSQAMTEEFHQASSAPSSPHSNSSSPHSSSRKRLRNEDDDADANHGGKRSHTDSD